MNKCVIKHISWTWHIFRSTFFCPSLAYYWGFFNFSATLEHKRNLITDCNVFKTSSRRLAKTSSRHLQDVFKTFWMRPQNVFKMSSRRLAKTSSRHLEKRLQEVLKTSSRRLSKISSRRFQDVEKDLTRFSDVLFQRRLSTEGYA